MINGCIIPFYIEMKADEKVSIGLVDHTRTLGNKINVYITISRGENGIAESF